MQHDVAPAAPVSTNNICLLHARCTIQSCLQHSCHIFLEADIAHRHHVPRKGKMRLQHSYHSPLDASLPCRHHALYTILYLLPNFHIHRRIHTCSYTDSSSCSSLMSCQPVVHCMTVPCVRPCCWLSSDQIPRLSSSLFLPSSCHVRLTVVYMYMYLYMCTYTI
jgi:hypothetical protein